LRALVYPTRPVNEVEYYWPFNRASAGRVRYRFWDLRLHLVVERGTDNGVTLVLFELFEYAHCSDEYDHSLFNTPILRETRLYDESTPRLGFCSRECTILRKALGSTNVLSISMDSFLARVHEFSHCSCIRHISQCTPSAIRQIADTGQLAHLVDKDLHFAIEDHKS
jgi:hypothetical protein